jgi:thioesterase domain-containing protein/acyl carrier protein
MGTVVAAATSPIEAGLKALWEEVLSIDGIGVEDDYFALGGTSLQSVKLFSEVERHFGVQLRLTTILAAPIVRALARLIEPTAGAAGDGLVLLRPGRNKNLFLVHDGLGETLLYLNLARRLPGAFSVYGIEPRRLPGIALAHATVEDMADYYVEQIRGTQAHGPYRLGGMCAGGVIAYAMAAQLRGLGEEVEVVLILDGATPQAPHRAGRIASARRARMRALMQGEREHGVTLGSLLALAGAVAKKIRNTVIYESSAFLARISARLRFALLQRLVRRDQSWPLWLSRLTVAQIYTALEMRYQPPTLPDVPVLLVRASQGADADTPYRDIYSGDDFGWRNVAGQLAMADVAGGHASMLQQAHVDSLASALLLKLPAWSETSVGGRP